MWYQSSGTLRYYPWGDWWVLLDCCEGLVSFYRAFAERKLGRKLSKPKHGAHITVVRGEGEPEHKEKWFWNQDGLMEFEYCNEIVFGETHVWLKVRSKCLNDLRLRLGLRGKLQYGFHLTLGRLVV